MLGYRPRGGWTQRYCRSHSAELQLESPSFEELSAYETGLTVHGLSGIADSMPQNCSLRKLGARDNQGLLKTRAGGEALGKILLKSPNFVELNAGGTGLTAGGLSGIADCMLQSCSLRKPEVGDNQTS